ncbi:MAG: metallophosphoesterase, partial [Gluconacetobacter diazotrophicus]|nr:metallophosphoesterase [Gluconacetobacter diazotrophicus]
MTASIGWLHVGDLHLSAADGWESRKRLAAIVAEANAHLGSLDLVFLPGDNADTGGAEEYAAMMDELGRLNLPWRTIPGDHDREPGDLANYRAAIPAASRPPVEVIAGHRCV